MISVLIKDHIVLMNPLGKKWFVCEVNLKFTLLIILVIFVIVCNLFM
jgi:hypothetical protein